MKVIVAYVYPFNGQPHPRKAYAERFLETYWKYPPGHEHESIIISNGGPPDEDTKSAFIAMPNLRIFEHDNSGWDIGAMQHVSREVDGDLMVGFGNSAYLRREGWLKRMIECLDSYGPDALYGSMQVNANLGIGVWAHIRTTGFWINPKIMAKYPVVVTDPSQRYPFEHGPNSFTLWCAQCVGCYAATFKGIYDMNHWHEVEEGYHWGEQKELLTGDRMTCPPYYPYT